MAVLTLAGMAGARVGDDPEDSDFGKIIIGDTRIDIWGGIQQPAALTIKAALAAGDNLGVYHADKEINPLDAGLRFLAYKSSPGVTVPYSLLFGKNIVGQKQDLDEAAIKAIMPMTIEAMVETFQNTGDPFATMAVGGLSFVGVGTSEQPGHD
jgi:hypothetical protein